MRNLTTSQNWTENFSVLMLKTVEFPKSSIKKKNCKDSTRHKQWVTLKEIILPLQARYNLTTSLGQKFSYKDIQKSTDVCFQSASRMQFLGVKKWLFFFRHQTEKCWLENLQTEISFWLCCESILFSILNELRFLKWVRFFERNCIVKCWLWDLK